VTRIKAGDEVILYLDAKRTYKVKAEEGKQFHTHKGYIELGDIIGGPYGVMVNSNLGVKFYALKPLVRDRVLKTDRRTQVLYPKDIGYILFQLGLGSGSRVLEAGTGSGALTMALAESVRPEGAVITYEVVERHMKAARGNIERSGLMPYVDMRLGDVAEGVPETELDAVVLDMATRQRRLPVVQPHHRAGHEDRGRAEVPAVHRGGDGGATDEKHHGGPREDEAEDRHDWAQRLPYHGA